MNIKKRMLLALVVPVSVVFGAAQVELPYVTPQGNPITDYPTPLMQQWVTQLPAAKKTELLSYRLNQALEMGWYNLAEKWIACGADVNFINIDDKTILYDVENAEAVHFLVTNGANIEHRDYAGITPLAFWCKQKNSVDLRFLRIMQALLLWGANPNTLDICGETPLLYAVTSLDEAKIQLLLDHGAQVVNCDGQGNSLFHLLAKTRLLSSDTQAAILHREKVIKYAFNRFRP